MPYQEISLDLIDSNPFQTRKAFSTEIVTGIATSSMDRHGLLQAPMVRPYGKRFQLAFGHGRIQAEKLRGQTSTTCRVEELTDAEMKKYVLIENVNRSELNEEERMAALEQYREELGLDPDKRGFIAELSLKTGIPETTISEAYDIKQIREKLILAREDSASSAFVIRVTRGLDSDDRVKLIAKATERGWSGRATQLVKTAIKDMDEEVRAFILEDNTKLTAKTIQSLSELDAKKQLETAQHIRAFKLNESAALSFIERIKTGDSLVLKVERVDEAQSVIDAFSTTLSTIKTWGYNQYWILYSANRWEEGQELLKQIEEQARWAKEASYARRQVESDVQ